MVDVLAIGAHPDDVEISAGGTLLKLAEHGRSVAVCTATDGEPTPNGSHAIRVAEAAEAAKVLGAVEYEILDMPNRYLMDTVENRVKIANVIRRHRPQVILCPHVVGFHPDHRAISAIVDAARFYAKLTRTDPLGNPWKDEPWWAPRQYYYFLGGGEEAVKPSFIVDITTVAQRKRQLLECYKSQWQVDTNFLSFSGRWGAMIGAEMGEAFVSRGPVAVDDIMVFHEGLGFPRHKAGDADAARQA